MRVLPNTNNKSPNSDCPPRVRSVNIAPDIFQAYRAFEKAMRYDVQTRTRADPSQPA